MIKRGVFFILYLILFSSGCSFKLPGHGDREIYYVINGGEKAVGKEIAQRPYRVLLYDGTSSRLVNTERIVFSEEPSQRGHYQFSFWAENPPKRFLYLLQKRLEEVGIFKTVSQTTSGAVCDLQIGVEITDFYHDVDKRPGSAVVKMRVELIDLRARNTLASTYFSKAVPTKRYSAEGAVDGFDQGVGEILEEVVLWLDKVVS